MLKSLVCWGMPTPWLPKLSKPTWLLLVVYDFMSLVVISFALFIFAFTMYAGNLKFQDVTISLPSSFLMTSALFLSLHQFLIKNRLKNIASSLDAIAQMIIESNSEHKEEFFLVYSKNSKKIINYCQSLPFLYMLSSSVFFCSVPIVDWYEGNYRKNFAMVICTPFDYKKPGMYEFVVLMMVGALSMSTGKQLNNALFFLAFFNTLRSFLNYLHLSMEEFQRKAIRNNNIKEDMRTWIKIHQEINRCLQDLLRLFSPTVVVNSMYMMFYLVGALFLQTQEQRNSIYQTFSAFIAVSVMMVEVYTIFNISDSVTFEAKELANAVYGLPWYEMDKRTKYEVQMVITMCNRPVHVSGYRTNALILNRETLAGIMTSALSAYLTLCQMKDAFGSKESPA